MTDTDSIDGLGLTFRDLSPSGQRLALFRLAQRQTLSNEQRAAIKAALTNAKNLSDKNEEVLLKLTQESQ